MLHYCEEVVHHFSNNKCMVDTISVAEHCVEASQLNWCALLLQELFEACEDVYKWLTHFIYRYLLVALAMWKWFPPKGLGLATIIKYQYLILRYTPWRTLGDPSSKEIN